MGNPPVRAIFGMYELPVISQFKESVVRVDKPMHANMLCCALKTVEAVLMNTSVLLGCILTSERLLQDVYAYS